MPAGAVVVGGGQAGFQLAVSLRAKGYDGPLSLICAEPHLPYQRPPLSKGYLTGKQDETALPFRNEAFYRDHGIDLLLGRTVRALDRHARRVVLDDGAEVPFAKLALALGATNRPLPVEGTDLDGVCYLRTREEAAEIARRLGAAERVVVVGGGFIGLEVAAAAAAPGRRVTVLEAETRLMSRVVAPIISDYYAALHAARGVDVVTGATVTALRGDGGRVTGVACADGSLHSADLVVIGIGVVPDDGLARAGGLACDNGILVDACLGTDDPDIVAIGDCANHPNPFAGGRVRLESVQNAADQGKAAAATLLGEAEPYRAVPWFWTDQFDIKLQMAGFSLGYDRLALRGETGADRFSVFYFRAGALIAVDSVNRPADHMIGRRLLAGGGRLTPEQATDAAFDLKAHAARAG